VRDGCTVLPMSSSAFAAVFLSGSGALLLKLLNMLTSPRGLNVGAMARGTYASTNATMSARRSIVRDRLPT
jgi:hypothetical protein